MANVMTADDWADVFKAGAEAIPEKSTGAYALSLALSAMAHECNVISQRY